ncbi:uncharacterized protein LOC108709393 isoform X2 [Xenopus laevis]|nr:uncharacterized protein LOC108709393 isoform X2 [Xenopus laevis]XP_018104664.1 uncharacterized protein LOC108709393 isoform X2 [Xenopus laevis]XP_018104665.1 uncharacterized protein LOC108709393 isoform X2 [Xenopus laevis]XP_041439655.1 uncharacterized protein LOC108709393 isoform X2 [Xenopus laevis]
MKRTNGVKMETKQRGKFSSLDKREAKKVLERYVKRSLSNSSEKTGYKGTVKRQKEVQRSASDLSRPGTLSVIMKESKLAQRMPERKEAQTEESLKIISTTDEEVNPDLVKSTDNADASQNVKKQSWFKNFFGSLFKKKDDKKEERTTSCVPEDNATISSEPVHPQPPKKTIGRKNSIRKAFSFKKKAAEEVNVSQAEADCESNSKPKKPTVLQLQHICRPSSFRGSKKKKDHFYDKVTNEIEQIVKESDNLAAHTRKESLGDELTSEEAEDPDVLIKKIVSILRKEGDKLNKKVKEDPTLSSFFREISYNSFKNLADVYVDKEVKNKVSDVMPEDIQFAYSVDFTAKVACISSHPVNRIMGFGSRYLQDTFPCPSYKRRPWSNSVDQDDVISPD